MHNSFSHISTLMVFCCLLQISISSCKSDSRKIDHETPDGSSDGDSDTDTDTEIDTDFPSDSIPETCEEAADNPMSVGCDFFFVDMDQLDVDDADLMPFSLVVSNPQIGKTASVSIFDNLLGELFSTSLAPGQLEVIDVSCETGCLVPPREIQLQGLEASQGFRLVSDIPVIAYQWNTYGISVFSTDASLLLPKTSLGDNYLVATWGIGHGSSLPSAVSQVTIVATDDNTQISLTTSVNVPEYNGVGPYIAGVETDPISLNAYDVATIRAATPDEDLTGTVVMSTKPIAVFGGHPCAKVPTEYYPACDHIEEQLFPYSALGSSTILARYAERENCLTEDLALWRIVAGADDMFVTFDPPAPSPANSEYYFETKGEVLEFLAPDDFYVEGQLENPENSNAKEAPFLAYQMMTGAGYANCLLDGLDSGTLGDPMMLLSPPAGQYLDRYVFTTDNVFDFDYDHIIIVRPKGSLVALDCKGLLSDHLFTEVGSSNWEVARVFIDNPDNTTGCQDGAHLLTASEPVGLSVVGISRANSYGYLGGIGVKPINPVIE